MNKRTFLTLICLSCLAALAQQPLNSETSVLFAGSGKCEQCHHSDGTALTENGVDVSMPTHWRSTMMANAAKDPLWQAKVTAESAEHPALAAVIQTKCNACHAPMGYKQADFDGVDSFTLAQMQANGLAKDGVSCSVCHQVQAANLGLAASFSAGYIITDSAVLYGPYDLTRNMIGYSAKQGLHIRTAGLCATCHMVITPYVDDSGNVAGEFPEQTPYLEWTNSDYYDTLPCQGCHMPYSADSQIIAKSERTKWYPFAYHHFAGGNILGLTGLKHNIGPLGLSAAGSLFDSTLARTLKNLESAADVTASVNIENDTLFAEVTIQNNAGHKLPTGIPLRRLWVRFRLADNQDRTLFESGVWDTAGRIAGLSTPYETHHDTITAQSQVQIYEGIMKDVNDSMTQTLLRAAGFLKDNRIPPKGFQTSHASYDTIAITGLAASDPDFNGQGSGSDRVVYQIGLPEKAVYTGTVLLCYQSVTPGFLDHLVSFSSPEIDTYGALVAAESREPLVIDSIRFTADNLTTVSKAASFKVSGQVRVGSPAGPGLVYVDMPFSQTAGIKLFDIRGHLVEARGLQVLVQGPNRLLWQRPKPAGVYVLCLEWPGARVVRKVLVF